MAADVALVVASSASVERAFSRFTDQQQKALTDYTGGSVGISNNDSFRELNQCPK